MLRLFGAGMLFSAVALAGCGLLPRNEPKDGVGIGRTIYEATDQLAYRSTVPLGEGQLVLVSTLVDVNNLNRSAPLGRLASELISSRLVQRRYVVHDTTYTQALDISPSGEMVLSREARKISQDAHAEAVVAGTYAVAGHEIWLNMRLLKADDGAVLSSVDAVLPLDLNTRKLVCSARGGEGIERCSDIPR